MDKLSDLIEAGSRISRPGWGMYVYDLEDDPRLCCCALGAAGLALLRRGAPEWATEIEIDEIAASAREVYRRFRALPGRELLRKASMSGRGSPVTCLPQAVGLINDRLMRSPDGPDPRPQIVAWLRELGL